MELVGRRVRVVRGITKPEKELLEHPEREYLVLRYSSPHGYAVIQEITATGQPSVLAGNLWFVHPEALDEVT